MVRVLLILLVGLLGILGLALAWSGRGDAGYARVAYYGGYGGVCVVAVALALLVRARWTTWALASVGAVGVVVVAVTVVVWLGITQSMNSMLPRDFGLGQPFALHSRARVVRVDDIRLRLDSINEVSKGAYVVKLAVFWDQTSEWRRACLKTPPHGLHAEDVDLDGYRLRLISVAPQRSHKNAGLEATLIVARTEGER